MTEQEFDELQRKVRSLEIARALHAQAIKDQKATVGTLLKDVKSVLRYQQGMTAIISATLIIIGILLQAGVIKINEPSSHNSPAANSSH